MRCTAFCVADAYKLSAISSFLKSKGYSVKQYRKVLHVLLDPSQENSDVFIFSYGCVVTWGLKRKNEQYLLKQLEQFAIKPLASIETDRFIFNKGKKTALVTHSYFNADIIMLESYDDDQLKLAISYGLAKSIQLESYETEVQRIIDKNAPFFSDVAKLGKISLRSKEISKRLGEIFVARSQINLNSEYLEAPEYFWEHPNLEIHYTMTEKFLDISRRVSALNQKLDVLHELFNMLNSQLQHHHGNFLEIIIILLIFFELAISIFVMIR